MAALETTGNVTLACEMARLPRRSAYDWREDDPEFAADWVKSLDLGIDALEDEANRRAREGTLEPVYYQGKEVGQIRKYSDILLIFLLKGRRPEVFRERIEHTGKGGQTLFAGEQGAAMAGALGEDRKRIALEHLDLFAAELGRRAREELQRLEAPMLEVQSDG